MHVSEGSLAGRAIALWRADPDVGFTLRVRVGFALRPMVLNVLFLATALVVIIASR